MVLGSGLVGLGLGLGCVVWSLGYGVWGVGFRLQALGSSVEGLGVRVKKSSYCCLRSSQWLEWGGQVGWPGFEPRRFCVMCISNSALRFDTAGHD